MKKLKLVLISLMIVNLLGCATGKDPQDPYEPINRKMFKLNMTVDKFAFRPVAKVYNAVTPNVVQARVTNFFNNVDLIPSVANDLLQFDIYHACMDTSRFVVNSTVGVAGMFDPASKIQLPLHHNDVGLTFARWGWKNSSYVVLPLWGPSTIRDGLALPPNAYLGIWPYVDPFWISLAAFGLDRVNLRAALLPSDQLVENAFDPYIFVRDAYLQYRQNQIATVNVMDPGVVEPYVPSGPAGGLGVVQGQVAASASANAATSNTTSNATSSTDSNIISPQTSNTTPNTDPNIISPQSTNDVKTSQTTSIKSEKLSSHSKHQKHHHKNLARISLPFPKKLAHHSHVKKIVMNHSAKN